MNISNLEKDYTRIISVLDRTRILDLLSRGNTLGVIGLDGKEYPAPTPEQLQEIFSHNQELVDRKIRQGFTQLQVTPMAMSISQFIDRVKTAIRKQAAAGKIIQTKQKPSDTDIPVRVNTAEPIWIWDRVRQALDTPNLVYFPQVYTDCNHNGLTKEEVIQKTSLCAVPGWSVGLIEPIPIMPQSGQGKVIGGRKQLEEYCTPREYLQILSGLTYQGATGWTPEDFLTHFITQLETTNQVSHDRYDSNAMWLLGAYLPNSMPTPHIVPVGYWARNGGRKIHLTAHRTGNRLRAWVGRSMVRLGI